MSNLTLAIALCVARSMEELGIDATGQECKNRARKLSPSAASLSGLPLAEQLRDFTKPGAGGLISAAYGTKEVPT